MKLTLTRRFIAAALAASALFTGSPSAWATSPTTLEVGPKEIILNSKAIANTGNSELTAGGYWPDTPWQVAYEGTNLAYYTASGGLTSNQGTVKTVGTLDNPIATSVSSVLRINSAFTLYADPAAATTDLAYTSMKSPTDGGPYPSYVSGGPTYQLSNGDLLMWYSGVQAQWMYVQAGGQNFYDYIGMARSTDDGATWSDLGEIMSPPVPYAATRTTKVSMGEPGNVVVDPTLSYFYCYTYVTTSIPDTRNRVIAARALISDVYTAATAGNTTAWHNYYNGVWTAPADGGLSSFLVPGNSPFIGWNTILENQYLNKYALIGTWTAANQYPIQYAESTDGISWPSSPSTRTLMLPPDYDGTNYLTAVGIETGIRNGPSFASNGEFYLDYESNAQAIHGYPPYLARRKIFVLDNFDNDTTGSAPSEPGWSATSGGGWTPALVEASPTGSSDHPNALYINPISGSSSNATKSYQVNGSTFSSTTGMDFHVEIYPVSVGANSISAYLGNATTQVFKVVLAEPSGVNTDYTLQYFSGGSWNVVGGANGHLGNTNITGAWHSLDINATSMSFATVSWDHRVIGTIPVANTATSINDILLYSSGSQFYVDNVFLYPSQPTDTFENNTTGLLPNGYFQYSGGAAGHTTLVSSSQHNSGSNSMEILTSGSDQAFAGRWVAPTASKWVEAQVYPVTMANNSWFDIYLSATSTHVFSVAIMAPNGPNSATDYTLQYSTATSWVVISHLGDGSTGALKLNHWNQIDVVATSTTNADVYFDGVKQGTAANWGTSSTISNVDFGCISNGTGGTQVYVDDVYISPMLLDDSDFDFDPTGGLPTGYSLSAGSGTAPAISATESHSGLHSLHVHDGTTAASVQKIVAVPTPEVGEPGIGGDSIVLQVYPTMISSMITIDLTSGNTGTTTTVFRLGIAWNATDLKYELGYYTGASTWNWLVATGGGTNAVNLNAWNEIGIVLPDPTQTTKTLNIISLNGATITVSAGVPNWHSAPSGGMIDRAVFSCAVAADDFYIDDVLFN